MKTSQNYFGENSEIEELAEINERL